MDFLILTPPLPQQQNPVLLPPVRRSRVHLPHPHILYHLLPLVRPQTPLANLPHLLFTALLGVNNDNLKVQEYVAVVSYCCVEAGCLVIEWGYCCSCGDFDEAAGGWSGEVVGKLGNRCRPLMEKTKRRRWWVLRSFRIYLQVNNKNRFTHSP